MAMQAIQNNMQQSNRKTSSFKLKIAYIWAAQKILLPIYMVLVSYLFKNNQVMIYILRNLIPVKNCFERTCVNVSNVFLSMQTNRRMLFLLTMKPNIYSEHCMKFFRTHFLYQNFRQFGPLFFRVIYFWKAEISDDI